MNLIELSWAGLGCAMPCHSMSYRTIPTTNTKFWCNCAALKYGEKRAQHHHQPDTMTRALTLTFTGLMFTDKNRKRGPGFEQFNLDARDQRTRRTAQLNFSLLSNVARKLQPVLLPFFLCENRFDTKKAKKNSQ